MVGTMHHRIYPALLSLVWLVCGCPAMASTAVTLNQTNAQARAWSFVLLEAGAAGAGSSSFGGLQGLSGVAAQYGQALVTLTLEDAAGEVVPGVSVSFEVDGDAAIVSADAGGGKAVVTSAHGQAVIAVTKVTLGEAVVTASWMAGAVPQQLSTTLSFVAPGTTSSGSSHDWTASAPGAIVRDVHTYAAEDAPAGLPGSLVLPYGLVSFAIEVTSPGDDVAITVTLPGPLSPDARVLKYLPTCGGGVPGERAWADVTDHVSGLADGDDAYTITLTDGGFGDADCQANGLIVDPQGPAQVPTGIPTLAEWALIALVLLMIAVAARRLRRDPGLAGAALGLLVLLGGGALIAGIATSPLGVAGHDPAAELGERTMRGPLQPDTGTPAVSIAARLQADPGVTVTGMTLHHRLAGGAWLTLAGAAAASLCERCWTAELPLAAFAAGDVIEYYLEVSTDRGAAFLYDGAQDLCADVSCGTNEACLDGACLCATGFAGAACDACAPGYHGAGCEHACHDALMNGAEADVDCGGPCPVRCSPDFVGWLGGAPPGQTTQLAHTGSFGMSGRLLRRLCATGRHGPTCQFACDDGVRNGEEQETDCGGPCVAPCKPDHVGWLGGARPGAMSQVQHTGSFGMSGRVLR
jgi:hypothetical protein